MKAEILRELGDFESAKTILRGITPSKWRSLVLLLTSL
jgi:hypothetical protein